jgi:hypothetical protein
MHYISMLDLSLENTFVDVVKPAPVLFHISNMNDILWAVYRSHYRDREVDVGRYTHIHISICKFGIIVR